MTATTLLLLGIACFRLTHLIVADKITEPLRIAAERRIKRLHPAGGAARSVVEALIGCPWCCGVWVAAALVAAWYGIPVVARPLVWFLAVAGVGVAIEMATRAWSETGSRGE